MPPRSSKDGDDHSTEIQFEVQEIRDGIHALRSQEPLQSRQSPDGLLMIDNQVYKLWENFILIWAVYSSYFTPLEFCFFRGLPRNLFFLNIAVQIAFLPDIIVQFYVTRRNPTSTTFHYFGFILDSLSCLPWDLIYKLSGRKEVVRYFLWIRLCRLRKVVRYLQKMEDSHINYSFTWIVNTIITELYCMHTATCIFYYLATTLPQSKDDYTWIRSLKLSEHNFQNFWKIDLWKCYLRSLYIAIVAMPTVGYGDMHSVNIKERVFIIIFMVFDMILGIYFINNMIRLIVNGWNTERFMNRMKDLIKYMSGSMNRLEENARRLHNECNKLDASLIKYMSMKRLEKNARELIKGHVRLHNESNKIEAPVLRDIPVSIRAKSGWCNNTQIKQLESDITQQIRRQELEPQRVNNAVFHGCLQYLKRLIRAGADPKKTDYYGCSPLHIAASKGFEDITLFLLQEGVDINACDNDGTTPLLDAIKGKHDRLASLLFDKGAKLGLNYAGDLLCTAASRGDSDFLKRVLYFGADPNSTNHNYHTALHIAAIEGFYLMAEILLEAGASVFSVDRWGITPLDEALKGGSSSFIKLFENAKSKELLKFPGRTQLITVKIKPRRCAVFPFHPCPENENGSLVLVPPTIKELINTAKKELKCSGTHILSEDGCKIFDTDKILDGANVYLV